MSGASDIFTAQARLFANRAVRCVIDVGAYDGDTPLIYARMFPDAVVHALEPDPDNFRKLEKSAASVSNIRPYRLAAGNVDGPAELHRNGFEQTHSLLPRPRTGKRYYPQGATAIGTTSVPAVTLDRFCHDRRIDFVDLLKLDIQGGEVAALTGAAGLLAERRIAVICTEVAFVPHYEGAPLLVDVWKLLAQHGYTVYDLHAHLYGDDGQLRYSDALFVSPDFRADVIDPMTLEP